MSKVERMTSLKYSGRVAYYRYLFAGSSFLQFIKDVYVAPITRGCFGWEVK